MSSITGEQIDYIIYQEKPEVNEGVNVTVPLTYHAYNGSFSEAYTFSQATLFQSEEEAVEIATLQSQMSKILKQDFNYIVIKRVSTKMAIYPKDTEVDLDDVPDVPVD